MLSVEEQKQIRKLLEMLSEENQKKVDVSNRLRDEEGKFLPNELKSETKGVYPSRSIRLVKVKGTYGTFLVKDWESFERGLGTILLIGVVFILYFAV